MSRVGTVSYNIYCNFTNYGSALQTWALHQAIKKLGVIPVLVDYCPDVLADKDPLNPLAHMWDQDEESRRMLMLSMPAIRENYRKFDRFYRERFTRTAKRYTSANFDSIDLEERLDGFVCGSDTIFCIDEFKGFDDGYYANYASMRGRSVAYAASFGDAHFDAQTYPILNERLRNFKAIGLREGGMLDYVIAHTEVPCARNLDPTLLLRPDEYDAIAAAPEMAGKYLLLYARRYDPAMVDYAERLAKAKGLKIVEISLRAVNAEKGHVMRYDAGVEEFLALVKHAEHVVTNSFHGLIFSVQYSRPFSVFSREQAGTKIGELLRLFGLENKLQVSGDERHFDIDYERVHRNIAKARAESMDYLKMALQLLKE